MQHFSQDFRGEKISCPNSCFTFFCFTHCGHNHAFLPTDLRPSIQVVFAYLSSSSQIIVSNESFSPLLGCTSQSEPYCRETSLNTFGCVQCISECDCPLDAYCSRAPGQVGECRDWDLQGDSCRPLSTE